MGPVKQELPLGSSVRRSSTSVLLTMSVCAVIGLGGIAGLAGCAAHGPKPKPARAAEAPVAPAAAGVDAPQVAALPCDGQWKATPASHAAPIADLPLSQALREGIAAYDAGRYAEALAAFEPALADPAADGKIVYRLAFCYSKVKNDTPLAVKTYEQALSLIEARIASGGGTLENQFYRINALSALNRTDVMKGKALEVTTMIEACAVPAGADGSSAFRVGKIYADAGLPDKAVPWFRRAIGAFAKEPNPPAAYVEWSSTEIAASDLDSGNWGSAVAALTKLTTLYPENPDIGFRLLIAKTRAGDFDGAMRDIQRLRPIAGPRADDMAYVQGMLRKARRMAKDSHAIPLRESDGRTYSSLSQAEIESRMREVADAGRTLIMKDPEPGSYTEVERGAEKRKVRIPGPELLTKIDAEQARLLALSLELVRRGIPIQEIAFTAGISPLVLQDWREQWVTTHRPPGPDDQNRSASSEKNGSR